MKTTYLAMASMLVTASLVACGGSAGEEEQETQLSSLHASCTPTAKVGTAEWKRQLAACIAERIDGTHSQPGTGTAGKDGTSSTSSGSSCRVSISCNGNDGCVCTTPGLEGTPCGGSTCGTVCKVCK